MNGGQSVQSRVFSGSLRWVGEHWICALKGEGEGEIARVSLYHTHASPAGEGVTAYVSIGGQVAPTVLGVFTDNRAVTAWVHDVWGGGRGGPFRPHPPVFDARGPIPAILARVIRCVTQGSGFRAQRAAGAVRVARRAAVEQ